MKDSPQLGLFRSPYLLNLLVNQTRDGASQGGLAALFTEFVRDATRREITNDNPLFAPGVLLTDRDIRQITQRRWSTPWELPDRGALFPKITELAYQMQVRSNTADSSHVRVPHEEALRLLDDPHDEELVRAGAALSVLDEDPGDDEVLFFHQLIQEYFASRRLASHPEPGRVTTRWAANEVFPQVRDLIRSLPSGERLPVLDTTGWEETTLLASG